MNEKELIRYHFGRADKQVEDWMETMRKAALAHFEAHEEKVATSWILVGGMSGTPTKVLSVPSSKSLLTLVDQKTRNMWLTVDVIGRLRFYLTTSTGFSCYTISLHDQATVRNVDVLTSFADTPARGYIEKVKMYREIHAHRHVDAYWLDGLVELPEAEPHIIQDALGQFW